MAAFGERHYSAILIGAWLQAVGPVFIVLFAFALVLMSGAAARLSGWMTFLGAAILMTVSLIEITFYISAMFPDPPVMPLVSMKVILAVQHLYFIVAAPALLLPLGIVILSSQVLPRVFGYLAIVLAATFAALGIVFLLTLRLPDAVTAFAGVQSLWWLGAAATIIARSGRIAAMQLDHNGRDVSSIV
jgi:hypothetical protein